MKKTYDFMLTNNEANLVLQALGELPAKLSMELIINIQRQAQAQEIEKKDNKKK